MKYCTNCGKKLKEGTSFCTACGHKVEKSEEKKLVSENVVNNQVKPKKFPVWAIVLIVLGVISFVLLSLGMFISKIGNNFYNYVKENSDNYNIYDDRYNKDDASENNQSGTIGDTLTGDEFKVTLIDAEKYDVLTTSSNEYTASEGNVYIVYYLEATNISDQNEFFNYLYWTAKADGKKVNYKNIIGTINDYSWATGDVEPGDTISGYIVFEAPEDFENFSGTYDENPFDESSSFTFNVINNN